MEKVNRQWSYVLSLVSCILFLFACENPTQKASLQKPYFDLTSFFNAQIDQLYKDSLIVMKTSAINGKSDEHQMDWTDWKREFALFFASDINKTSLVGKYSIDTIHSQSGKDSGSVKISYMAEDSSMRTRLLKVTFNNREVKEIFIINRTSSFLSSSSENLMYLPMRAYVIKTSTNNRFFGGNDFSTLGQITTKEKKYF